MSHRIIEALNATVSLWDGLVTATAATPLLPRVDSTGKAVALILGAGVTVFGAGAGTMGAVATIKGTPARLTELEARQIIFETEVLREIRYIRQEVCDLRAKAVGEDPVLCFRAIP
jgi:hypothetical protein